MRPALQAFHLEVPGGFRFCVLRRPPAGVEGRGAILHVPAFAEEMNKSRHMVALQADAWAREGWSVLQIDLHGCGDSSGELIDATWEGWLEDVRCAHEWLMGQGLPVVWMWGLRLGGLLAAEAVGRFGLDCGLLLWQPVTSGKQHLQQFLRLWKMGQVIGKQGHADASPQALLDAGVAAEVGGYVLSPALAEGMRGATMAAVRARAVHWFQVSTGAQAEPLPAFERLAAGWRDNGVSTSHHAVEGPSFWQAQEIAVAPGLLSSTSSVTRAEQVWEAA